MILKISRPLTPVNAPFEVSDQTGTVHFQIEKVPYRVGLSCHFRPAYWTAIVKEKNEIEFRVQVEGQNW